MATDSRSKRVFIDRTGKEYKVGDLIYYDSLNRYFVVTIIGNTCLTIDQVYPKLEVGIQSYCQIGEIVGKYTSLWKLALL